MAQRSAFEISGWFICSQLDYGGEGGVLNRAQKKIENAKVVVLKYTLTGCSKSRMIESPAFEGSVDSGENRMVPPLVPPVLDFAS